MALSMIINQSLVARTFGTYTLQLSASDPGGIWGPVLAVGRIVVAFLVNLAGNKVIGIVSDVSAVINMGGLHVFAAIAVAAPRSNSALLSVGLRLGAISTLQR